MVYQPISSNLVKVIQLLNTELQTLALETSKATFRPAKVQLVTLQMFSFLQLFGDILVCTCDNWLVSDHGDTCNLARSQGIAVYVSQVMPTIYSKITFYNNSINLRTILLNTHKR